jgi:VWFA-related protein
MLQNRFSQFFRHPLCCSLLLILFTCALSGQNTPTAGNPPTPSSTAASSTEPIVKNVDEVVIDFVARNKKKKPVLDLKPEDMIITDNGAAVQLSALRLVTKQSDANHHITLLFDPLDPSAATNAREVARKILKLIPANGFSFSVFNVNGRLRLFQDFTADRTALQKAINDATADDANIIVQSSAAAEKKLISVVQSDGGQLQSPANDRISEQAMLASLTASQRIIQDQRLAAPYAGLLAIVRSQSAIPGRKLLIYFTEGAQSDPDAHDVLRSVADAANRAEVSVYVIDKMAVDTKLMDGLMETAALGGMNAASKSASMSGANTSSLSAGMAAQVPTAVGPGMAAQVTDTMTRMEGDGLDENKTPLGELASRTGGTYIYSQDNLKKPFARAVADLTTYYEASYVPMALDYNGKFRPVTVKTLRPNLRVQARPGYFAVPPKSKSRLFEGPLVKLLSQTELPTDVTFRTAVLQLGNLSTGNESTLVTEVPVSALEVRSEPNANLITWHVSIVSQIKNEAGAVVEHFSDDIPGRGAFDAEEQVKLGCSTMQRHFALPPGKYVLETAVADRISGKLGAERVNFEVPVVASGPFLSDVTLVRRIDSAPDELDPFEPLRYQQGKVVPSLSGQVSPDAKNISFFFLVSADSSISEPALLEMQVLRNGELLGQVPLQLPKNLERSFPYVASLKTDSLAAGNYAVRLSLAQGDRIIERERTFSIAGPELARAGLDRNSAAGNNAVALAVADSSPEGPDGLPVRREPLVITSLPANSVARPSEGELDGIIAGARKHAINYSAKLPNFLCVEVTDRSVDPSGNGRWRRKDSFGELLRYADNQETRTTLEVNGQPSTMKRAAMKDWPISVGEFGDLLNLVFQPSSKTEFHWKETDALANGTVQVFDYRVESKNNSLRLTDDRKQVNAGFHGVAYIDSATMGIRRITMEADDLPADFSIHAASLAIDYDYVRVGANDYLMPVRGTIRLKRGRHEVDLNQIVFQDYRRYAAETKIIALP